MDLKRLRTFVSVAEEGTISVAAEALRITQPALSRQLQDLQAEFGVALFNKVGRRLQLTTEGAALLPECRSLISQADALIERGKSLARDDRGVLRVGATPHVVANYFPGFLRKFALKFPNVRLQPMEGGGLDHVEALRRGELHAAVTPLEGNGSDFITFPLPPVRLMAAFRNDPQPHPVARIEVHDLAERPLLVLTQNFGIRKTFDAACRLARFTPQIFLESRSPETLLAFARESHGVAIVPSTALIDTRSLRLAPLVYRGSHLEMPIGVHWNRRSRQPRYADDFNAILAEHMQLVVSRFEQGHDERNGTRQMA